MSLVAAFVVVAFGLLLIAFTGVGMAAVYSLRLFIKTMHNRVGADVTSRDINFREGLVLVPLVAVIVALAFVPQFALHKGEETINRSVSAAGAISGSDVLATHPEITVIR